jgi:diguanylate cyclase (GGDEF)-like protein
LTTLILSAGLFIALGLSLWINHRHTLNNKLYFEEREFFKSLLNRPENAIVVFSKKEEVVFVSDSAKSEYKSLLDNPKKILQFDPSTNTLAAPYDNIMIKKSTSIFNYDKYDVFTLTDKESSPEQQEESLLEEGSQQNIATLHPLTGLPSEHEAISKITALINERKNNPSPFGVYMFGIDHFKEINTTIGHHHTNRLIKDVGMFLKEHSDQMFLYHLSCEKFLFIMPECFKDMTQLNIFARDFLTSVNTQDITHQDIHLSGSLGITKYPDDGNTPAKLLDNAFKALTKAQQNKESNFELYRSKDEDTYDKMKINDQIIHGLENKEFVLFFQPIFDVRKEEIAEVEVLLRWNHPEHGLISPDRFLNVAEQTGLVIKIGEYVFEEAVKQKQIWNEAGLNKLIFTINLSLREMQIESLILKLEKYLSKYDIQPSEFNLDITEEAAMLHYQETKRDIKLFRDSGISLTLDDFGSGLFSLSHLQQLPFNKLKLDRSLTSDLESNKEHRTTVKSIIALANTLGLEVGVEGIESKEMVDVLKEIGCHYAQGYYFSKPLGVDDFLNYYQNYHKAKSEA